MIPSDHVLCFADFETTGIDLKRDVPIEVGLVFTDFTLRTVAEYDALIWLPGWDRRFVERRRWSFGAEVAAAIHGIGVVEWRTNGEDPTDVWNEINGACDRHRPEGGKVVLVSDNIQFEWQLMLRLRAEAAGLLDAWPFHYCGWDTSFLLEAADVGDPDPVPHRALPDARLVVEACREAVRRIERSH